MTLQARTGTAVDKALARRRDRLQSTVAWSNEHRQLHEDAINEMEAAGVFQMRRPRTHGGTESGTRELLDVAIELAQTSGSLAWTASVYSIPTWMAGLFPEAAQEEIFSAPHTRVSGTLSPGGEVTRCEGGVRLKGMWGFMSGAHHAHWHELIGVEATPAGPLPVMMMVPASDVSLIDDWQTSALRGTGSVSVVADDIFVPEHRAIPLPVALEGAAEDAPSIYRAPLLPVASASSVGTVVGLGQRALGVFLGRAAERGITYTDYDSQLAAPLTHHQVARATMMLDEALFHARRLTDGVDQKADANEQWSREERARARADMGAAVRLSREAVTLLAGASGGSSVYSKSPISDIHADIRAIGLHALMNPDTNDELFGRILCGQEPDTLYL